MTSGIFISDVENAKGIKEELLNSPFIDAFFFDPEPNSNIIPANLRKKIAADLVDWGAYYMIERDDVSEVLSDG